MATKSLRESLQDKGSRRTPEEQAQLDLLVKAIIDKTAANEILEDRHFRNIAEAKEHEK